MRLSIEAIALDGGATLRGEFLGLSENQTPWPQAVGRFLMDEVGSTFDAAVSVAKEAPAPFWVMARRQSKARGRRGRAWHMPDGNFAATVLIESDDAPSLLGQRSFVMALAVRKALLQVTHARAATLLKWPNDVLLNGGKLAGILLESDGKGRLMIGVGVNLKAAPALDPKEGGALPAVSLLEDTGISVTPEAFLDALAMHFAREEARFQTSGFGPLRTEWMASAAKLGETIRARLPHQEFEGRFEGLDDEGHLILRTAQGVKKIAAGDVYF